MSRDTRQDEKIAAAIRGIEEKEVHKRLLYDRTIGGPIAPRPSVDFIRENVGPLKGGDEIRREAEGQVRTQEKAEREARENRAEFERSVREHNARLDRESQHDGRGGEPHSNRDELRREQGRDTMSARDRLRQDRDAPGQQLDPKGPNRTNIDR